MQDQYGVPGISAGTNEGGEEEYDDDGNVVKNKYPEVSDLSVDPTLLRKTSGYLYKRASDSKKWKKRFFVLKHELKNRSDPFELYYFSKPSDTTPKAIIVLDGAEVVAESRNAKEKGVKNEFQLYVAGGAVVELYADTKEERQDWLDTLGAVIAAHRRRMHVASGMNLSSGGASGGLYNIAVTEDQALSCEAFGPGLFGAEAGIGTSFTIQATDSSGQTMIEGGMPFTATLENDEYLYNINILDNNDGTYSAQYAISAPGDYDLAVKLNDEYHIFGSPFAVRVSSGKAEPRKCRVRGEGLMHAKSMETAYFIIEARDTLGNDRTSGGDPFEVSLSGPAVLKGLQDNNDGTYNCAFEVTATADTVAQVPNAVRMNVTLNGTHLPGSPFVPRLEAPDGNWEVVHQPTNGASAPEVAPVPPTLSSSGMSPPLAPPPNQTVMPVLGIGTEKHEQQRVLEEQVKIQSQQDQLLEQQQAQQLALLMQQQEQESMMLNSFEGDYDTGGFNVSALQPLSPTKSTSGLGAQASAPISPSQSSSMSRLAMASARAKTARNNRSGDQRNLPGGKNVPNPEKVMSALTSTRNAGDLVSSSGGSPEGLSEAEMPVWESALSLMRDPLILPMFEAHGSHLMLIFDSYSHGKTRLTDGKHTVKTLPLMGPTGTKKGAVHMAVDYDIVPSFLTKREVKSCFNVVSRMQSAAGSSTGLDFSGFIQLLGLLAVVSLSKPSFQHLYPSNNAKVGVLLEMWGFSDPIKLQMVQRGAQ